MSANFQISPPKWPLKFLRWFCDPALIEDVEGDLSELFSERKEKSSVSARMLYLIDVLLLIRPGIIKNFKLNIGLINTTMIKNYLKVAFRNAKRYKGFTALNILGLVIGLVSSILILLWVNDEIRIDKFHTNGDRIYQVFRNMKQAGGMVRTTWTVPKPAADLIRAEYPEVDDVVQVSWTINMDIEFGESSSEERGFFVTPNFLSMFSFDVITGDANTALNDVNSIMISRTVAEKYFGSFWKEKAVGSQFKLDGNREAMVSGVFENIGDNSSVQFDWLMPAQHFFSQNEWVDDWGNGSFKIYFLADVDDIPAIQKRIYDEIIVHAAGQDNAGEEYLIVHKFEDYYLYSNFENGVISGGRIDNVKILTIVAVFLLAIASINFMNLATARSGRRSKEVGLRKVMGAYKSSISVQFFVESILLSAISMIISVLFVWLLLPYFNQLVDKNLSLDFTLPFTWYFLIGLILLVGLLSGIYPAILLPTFNIINSLKGAIKQSTGAGYFRKGLVVFQFGISTLLIIGTGVVYSQLQYILTKDLGLDKENLMAIRMGERFGERLETYKTELTKIPEVKAFSSSSGNPISTRRSTSSARWEGMNKEGYEINILLADEHLVNTMGMEMLSGRDFDQQLQDSTNFLINEVMAELMGFDDPLGKKLSFWGINGQVVGVVKNFHMSTLREPIAPLIISCFAPSNNNLALLKIQGDTGKALKSIEETIKDLNPENEFDYRFIDQAYAESYETEVVVGKLARIFAFISVLISCLGLLGLSAYTAEQRSKEIGIRKVHGASIYQILLLLTKDYSKLMILAFILAVPFGYYYAQSWLDNYEFRTSIGFSIFITGGILTFIIGVLTVTAKSYQAATENPVKSLRDE